VYSGALIAALIALLAPFAVRVVLGHGRLTPQDISAVAGLLRLFSLGFIATMGALLLERLYLAHSRNRLLAGLAILRGGVRLGLVILCLGRLGLSAFAVGYVTADWVYLLALIAVARTMGLVKTPVEAQA
jgi:peptidoglycan biosynthesis protein MviN/MurJ (putative lipid II flippase)